MKILIDADGCPVVDIAARISKERYIECFILCDTAHILERDGATTLIFSKGADSVDFALVNRVSPGDIVITQDYGLAAMCLAKKAVVINQDGMEYTADNIDALLLARHTSKKIRNSGGRLKGPKKRSAVQDEKFHTALTFLLDSKVR
ncbi:MAG TPA: YaiI/YqxD family protein [Bacillota bacterium]|nr:YaiI/YqxD family protein [Bacillota bacterium]